MSRRGLYPPRNVKANVVPSLGFPSPVQLQGGREGVCGPKRKRDRRYLDCNSFWGRRLPPPGS